MDNEYDTASEPVETFNIPNLQPLDDLLREGAEDASQRQENLTRGTHENYTWWLRSARRSHDMVIGHALKGAELRKAAKTVGLTFDLVHKIHRIHENLHIIEKRVREDQVKKANKFKFPTKTMMLRWVKGKPDGVTPPTRKELIATIFTLKAEIATLRATPEPVKDGLVTDTPATETPPETVPEQEPDPPDPPGTSVTPSGEAMTITEAVARVAFTIIPEGGKPQAAPKPPPKPRVKAAGVPKTEAPKPEIPWLESPQRTKFEGTILYASTENRTANEMLSHLSDLWARSVDWSERDKEKFWEMIHVIAATQDFSAWLVEQEHTAVFADKRGAIIWDADLLVFRALEAMSRYPDLNWSDTEAYNKIDALYRAMMAAGRVSAEKIKALKAIFDAAKDRKEKVRAGKAWRAAKALDEERERGFRDQIAKLSGQVGNRRHLKALELDKMPSKTGLTRQYHKLALKLRNDHGGDMAPEYAAGLMKLTAARDALRMVIK